MLRATREDSAWLLVALSALATEMTRAETLAERAHARIVALIEHPRIVAIVHLD